ncbi:MAG: SusC/RagA family TonB-linked outer membrane protein, partial [Hymenobacter sp.]
MRNSTPLARRLLLPTLLAAAPLMAAAYPALAATPATENPAGVRADIKISGQVTDEKGQGLPGVTVVVKGTTQGTNTDMEGAFLLTAPDNATLVLSSVGYKTQEVAVAGRKSFTVSMEPTAQDLGEVVVTGYQTQRKADLTGAVSVIKTDEVRDLPSSNPVKNLQGRVPGVSITTDGSPGGASTVRIRGIGTLGNNDPLYVIDGIPTREGIGQINQNDIESIQVLKDASSASIYGSRASNGVIIITTKKARKGVTRVGFSTFVTVQTPGPHIQMLNTLDYGRIYGQAALNDGITPNLPFYNFQTGTANGQTVLTGVTVPEYLDAAKTMRTADTDWFKEIQRNAFLQSYNLNISNGGERGGVLFSLNYYDNKGIIKTSEYNRWTARLNSDYNFFNNRLKVGENLTVAKTQESVLPTNDPNVPGINFIRDRASQLLSIVPVHTVDGVGWGGPVSGISDRDNPVRLLEDNAQNKSNLGRAFGNVFADLELLKGLHLRSSFGLDYALYKYREIYKTYTAGYLSEANNRVTDNERFYGNWVLQNTLNYSLTLGEGK